MFVGRNEKARTDNRINLFFLQIGVNLFLLLLVLINADEVIFGIHWLQSQQLLCEPR